jgi:hypothetical protein
MSTIDPRWIDVDFPSDPKFVFGDVGLAHFDPTARAGYGDVVPVIPEAEWRTHIDAIDAAGGGADLLVTRIYNQGNEGSCVANACSQALEIIQAKQFGRDKVVPLSAISLYKRIGSSPNSGAMVSDGLDEIASRGVLPLDTPANRARFGSAVMPNVGFRTPFPAGWEATAANFKAHEWLTVDTVQELITALIHQHPVVVGRAGHSICYCRPMYQSGQLVVKYANSWGDWGDAGFGYDSMRLIRSSASWAFALRSVVIPSGGI